MKIKASAPSHHQLLRVLGLAFGVAVAVGSMIGAGILRTPGGVLGHAPSMAIALLLWAFGSVHALIGANVVSEIMTSVPRSGGLFVPARAAFGDTAGLLIGWSDWLNMVASVAALAIAAGEFSAILLPRLHGAEALTGASFIAFFFALNWLGVREGSAAQILGSAAKGVFLLVLVGLVLFLPPSSPAAQTSTPAAGAVTLAGILIAYQLIFGVYSGWPNPSYFAEEDKAPGRNIPRAMGLSIVFVGALYLVINLTLYHALPLGRLQQSQLPLADGVSSALGPLALKAIAAGAVLIVVGCLNANLMVGSRVLYGLARDGLFPRTALAVNRGGTPSIGLVATTALGLALTFTGSFETMFLLMGSLAIVPLIVADASLFKLRRDRPDLPRPFRALGYPALPALALTLDIALFASFLWTDPLSGLSVAGALLLCIPVAAVLKRSRQSAAAPADATEAAVPSR